MLQITFCDLLLGQVQVDEAELCLHKNNGVHICQLQVNVDEIASVIASTGSNLNF